MKAFKNWFLFSYSQLKLSYWFGFPEDIATKITLTFPVAYLKWKQVMNIFRAWDVTKNAYALRSKRQATSDSCCYQTSQPEFVVGGPCFVSSFSAVSWVDCYFSAQKSFWDSFHDYQRALIESICILVGWNEVIDACICWRQSMPSVH